MRSGLQIPIFGSSRLCFSSEDESSAAHRATRKTFCYDAVHIHRWIRRDRTSVDHLNVEGSEDIAQTETSRKPLPMSAELCGRTHSLAEANRLRQGNGLGICQPGVIRKTSLLAGHAATVAYAASRKRLGIHVSAGIPQAYRCFASGWPSAQAWRPRKTNAALYLGYHVGAVRAGSHRRQARGTKRTCRTHHGGTNQNVQTGVSA